MKKVIKACFMVFAFFAAIVVFAPKTFAGPVPVIPIPDDYVEVTDITITGESSVMVGGTINLKADITPENATNKRILWNSNMPNIASVDYKGKVLGVAPGTAIIQAYVWENGTKKIETKRITVLGIAIDKVIINTSYLEIGEGQENHKLSARVEPSTANQNITWKSSNTSIVKVDGITGKVTGVREGYADIKAIAANGKTFDSIQVHVKKKAEWTIMIYMAPADMESTYGAATKDLLEILSVKNQPDDVNIIIQTIGTEKWNPYEEQINIDKPIPSSSRRYYVKDNKLNLDPSYSYMKGGNSGDQYVFQDFLEWGLTSYPAKKTGVIFYGHGGAMQGVCPDETSRKNYQFGTNQNIYPLDALLNSEVNAALKSAFANTKTDKLEFVAYNSCLMAFQDVAEFNSHYFKYMLASQELLYDTGFDYRWVDSVYKKKDTLEVLREIAISYNGDKSRGYDLPKCFNESENQPGYQTISCLDLSYMEEYRDAFEKMAGQIKDKSYNLHQRVYFSYDETSPHHYAELGQYSRNWVCFGSIDVRDFINKIQNTKYNPNTYLGWMKWEYTPQVLDALNKVVLFKYSGTAYGDENSESEEDKFVPCGLSMFLDTGYAVKDVFYAKKETNFSTWRFDLTNNKWS